MGATATRQTAQILDHVETIVAIELLSAAQGIDFRRRQMGIAETELGKGTRVAYDIIRQHVPFMTRDVALAPHIEAVRRLVAAGTIKEAVEEILETG